MNEQTTNERAGAEWTANEPLIFARLLDGRITASRRVKGQYVSRVFSRSLHASNAGAALGVSWSWLDDAIRDFEASGKDTDVRFSPKPRVPRLNPKPSSRLVSCRGRPRTATGCDLCGERAGLRWIGYR
jgi:hypothetical protein